MSVITSEERFAREKSEASLAWKLLRLAPEYRQDYKFSLKLSHKEMKEIKALEEKWGFYPLSNPNGQEPDLEFLNAFASYKPHVDPLDKAVDFNALDICWKDKRGLLRDPENNIFQYYGSSKIDITIDLKYSDAVIVKELIEELTAIRELLEIQTITVQTHDHLEFLANLFCRMGLNDNEIKERLTSPEIKALSYQSSQKDAYRKRVNRYLEKARRIS